MESNSKRYRLRQNKTKIMRAWLKCDSITQGRFKGDRQVVVTGADGNSVTHQIPVGHVHPREQLQMILVCVFKDNDGWWVRFPVDSPYKPFRVERSKLRKA